MADEFTTTQSLNSAGNAAPPQEEEQNPTPPKVAGPGKQFNGFTGEEEDAAPLNLSLSPADQRIAAAPPHTDPLPDMIDRAVNQRGDAGVDVGEHVGPSMTEDPIPGETPLPVVPQHDTPDLNNEGVILPGIQHIDVPPTNDTLVDEEGAKVNEDGNPEGVPPYVGLDTAAYNDSINARLEAEAKDEELPPIEPPVPGDARDPDTQPEPAPEPDTQTEPTPDVQPEPAPEPASEPVNAEAQPSAEATPGPAAEEPPQEGDANV